VAVLAIAAPGINDLRARTVPLAAEMARLGSAAQFFSGLGNQDGKPTAELLTGFKEARTKLRALQGALKNNDVEEANALLDELAADCERHKAILGTVDRDISIDELERYISGANTVTADLLARLIDYYAEVAERGASGRAKLVTVAVVLANREACGTLPGRISQAFRKRGVLRFSSRTGLDKARIKWAADLRRRILAVGDAPESEVSAVQAELLAYQQELGDDLHGLAGLCVAVTLELARRESETALERTRVRGFDTVITDLAGLVDNDPELLAKIMGPDDEIDLDATTPAPSDCSTRSETSSSRRSKAARARSSTSSRSRPWRRRPPRRTATSRWRPCSRQR